MIIKGANPASFKSKFEFDNGDPNIDPRLKKEAELTVKQQKLAGTYKEKAAPEDEYKVSADGFFVEGSEKEAQKEEEEKKVDEKKVDEKKGADSKKEASPARERTYIMIKPDGV